MTAMRLRVVAAAALLAIVALTACGSVPHRTAGSGTSSPTPVANPSPVRRLLALLLPEAGGGSAATVEWTNGTGNVQAKATFTTPVLSPWTNATPLLQPSAKAAVGLIFYVDAQGIIRTLGPHGSVKTATTLVLRPGQNIVSFAVSPDGRRIAASILNYPPPHNPPPSSASGPFLQPGDWWYDYETATVGQAAQRVVSRDLGTYPTAIEPTGVTTVVGWDAGGPVAVTDTQLSMQYPPFSTLTPGSALVQLGPDGSHLDQVGDAGCIPLDTTGNGDGVCYTTSSPKNSSGCVLRYLVNSSAGAALWSASWNGCVYNPRLSPLSDRFCTDSGTVYNKSGTTTSLPETNATRPETCLGWVDDSTVVLLGSAGAPVGQVYTYDLVSQTRTNLTTAWPGVQYLGTVGGKP
jgi:hypothetical protein